MELALNEVKIQAKKLLNTIKVDSNLQQTLRPALKKLGVLSFDEIKLKHCLTLISQQLGFDNWHHAHEILSGSCQSIESLDMGSFFYPDGADMFINEWFANYRDAKDILLQPEVTKWLLPYKNQYIVVKKDYIATFKLDDKLMQLWDEVAYDMVECYNSLVWDQLACGVINNRPRNY